MANELIFPSGFINAINDIKSPPIFAFIHVDFPEGSTCYAESSDGDFEEATTTSGEWIFGVHEPFQNTTTWTFTCYENANETIVTHTESIVVDTFGSRLNVVLGVDPILNNNDWATISKVALLGLGDFYWDLGDCKEVILNGSIGAGLTLSNLSLYVYILDFNHPINKTIADNNIIFGGFKTALIGGVDVCLCDSSYDSASYNATKYFTMNHYGSSGGNYNTNYGGWKGCDFRYDILGSTSTQPSRYGSIYKTTNNIGYDAVDATITNPVPDTLMAALPSDFRSVLRLWNRYVDFKGNSSNINENCSTVTIDAISLLAEFEIFGARTVANQYEQNHQKQMTYYTAGNSKVKYKYNATSTAAYWWESSAYYDDANCFCSVYTDGSTGLYTTRASRGLAPAFKV